MSMHHFHKRGEKNCLEIPALSPLYKVDPEPGQACRDVLRRLCWGGRVPLSRAAGASRRAPHLLSRPRNSGRGRHGEAPGAACLAGKLGAGRRVLELNGAQGRREGHTQALETGQPGAWTSPAKRPWSLPRFDSLR